MFNVAPNVSQPIINGTHGPLPLPPNLNVAFWGGRGQTKKSDLRWQRSPTNIEIGEGGGKGMIDHIDFGMSCVIWGWRRPSVA